MEIERYSKFNKLTGQWDKFDKILKVIPQPFNVKLKDVKRKERYIDYSNSEEDWKYDDAISYGIEQLAYERGLIDFDYVLVDGQDNIIENEKEFDEYVENFKKYNL